LKGFNDNMVMVTLKIVTNRLIPLIVPSIYVKYYLRDRESNS